MKTTVLPLLLTILCINNTALYAQNGNFGVGTATPVEKLHVNGNIELYNTTSAYGSYLQIENSEGVISTVQSTKAASPYGARGVVGTTSAHPLQFVYNASPVVYLDNGTLAPNGSNLTYLGSDLNRWNGVYAGGGGFDAKNASGLYVGVQTESQNGVQSIFGSAAAGSAFGAVTYVGSKTNNEVAFLFNNSPCMYMNGDGFYPNGNNLKSLGYVGTAALTQVVAYNFTTPSDIRFKKNIETLSYGINDIMKIKPVVYDLRDNKNANKQIGFIAQDMEKIIPEIVNTNKDADAYKSIDYIKLIPVLIKGIQEQQELIASQADQLKELQKKIDLQKQEMTALKTQAADEKTLLDLIEKVQALQKAIAPAALATDNGDSRQ